MRMNRRDWVGQFLRLSLFAPRRPVTQKTEKAQLGKNLPNAVPGWMCKLDGNNHVVKALTKSEARGVLKKNLGLKRIPPGVVFSRYFKVK